jgi:4-diphosphocytidyl-2-C-methyl-D-erythritol kinase
MASRLARAKINLFLHAGGRRPDGYTDLASWVVFARAGDTITAESADEDRLIVEGPFAAGLDAGPGNLVFRAADALSTEAEILGVVRAPVSIRLTKSLPVASGIGGGSADAAATLLLLNEMWGLPTEPERMLEIGLSLGSDVPACLYSRSVILSGRGETIADGPVFPPLPCVLVNPGISVSTKDVFARLDRRGRAKMPSIPGSFGDASAVARYLASAGNDLEAPATALAPVIAHVRAALGAQDGCLLTRMSGSGATCFGLFASTEAASAAAVAIKRAQPRWWVAATVLEEPMES